MRRAGLLQSLLLLYTAAKMAVLLAARALVEPCKFLQPQQPLAKDRNDAVGSLAQHRNSDSHSGHQVQQHSNPGNRSAAGSLVRHRNSDSLSGQVQHRNSEQVRHRNSDSHSGRSREAQRPRFS